MVILYSLIPGSQPDMIGRVGEHVKSNCGNGRINSVTCCGYWGIAMIAQRQGESVYWDGDHTPMPTVTHYAWSKRTA